MITIVDFIEYEKQIRFVRNTVFTQEQNVDEAIDFNGSDPLCWHVLATDKAGNPVGTGRIQQDGHIGRVAVLKECRGCGIGTEIMLKLIEIAKDRGMNQLFLHSQYHALGFYQRLGFIHEGETFFEADILHQKMVIKIKTI